MDVEPVFLINEDRLVRLCDTTARNNNELARSVGQPERLTRSELMDLYYAQGGRCALTGTPLEYHESLKHYRRIQLDHIVERKARCVVANAIAGNGPTEYGKIACLSNVQWVCRFANWMKEYIRSAGLDYAETVRAMARHANEGFPIRSEAAYLGVKGKREYREHFLRQQLSDNPGISAREACARLAGTMGEACEATVRREMLQLIGQPVAKALWSERRQEVIKQIVSKHGIVFETKKEFVDLANSLTEHYRGFSSTQWHNDLKQAGIVLEFRRSRRNVVCVGDRIACLNALKRWGDDGASTSVLHEEMQANGVPQNLLDAVISDLCDAGAAYSHEGRLFAALTRAEAADRIGVSPNRLKKWGRSDWHDAFAGPSFVKQTKKGATYYKRHEVDDFSKARGRHHLDISVAGDRWYCTEGGKSGGRPRGGGGVAQGTTKKAFFDDEAASSLP